MQGSQLMVSPGIEVGCSPATKVAISDMADHYGDAEVTFVSQILPQQVFTELIQP